MSKRHFSRKRPEETLLHWLKGSGQLQQSPGAVQHQEEEISVCPVQMTLKILTSASLLAYFHTTFLFYTIKVFLP